MKLLGWVLVVLTIDNILSQTSEVKIDDYDEDLNLDPTIPRHRTPPPVTATRGDVNTTNPNPNCECVLFNLCKNNTLNTNGEGLLEIRINERTHCPQNIYYVCCPLPNQVKPDNRTIDNNVIPDLPSRLDGVKCGQRNPEGVGFRTLGNIHNETQFGEFPWMVAIWMEDDNPPNSNFTIKCGGSLIHPQVVMTAGHCVRDRSRHEFLRARMGEWDIETRLETIKHQDREVETVVIHPDYYSGGLHNDIALLFLKEPVKLTESVDTICLPQYEANFDYAKCIVTGWGAVSETGHGQRFLKQLELPVVPRAQCLEALRKTPRLDDDYELHASFICAGGVLNVDTCKGDGGSPLVCPIPGRRLVYQQVGIVSWGIGCGSYGVPALYANVPLFTKWIEQELTLKSLSLN